MRYYCCKHLRCSCTRSVLQTNKQTSKRERKQAIHRRQLFSYRYTLLDCSEHLTINSICKCLSFFGGKLNKQLSITITLVYCSLERKRRSPSRIPNKRTSECCAISARRCSERCSYSCSSISACSCSIWNALASTQCAATTATSSTPTQRIVKRSRRRLKSTKWEVSTMAKYSTSRTSTT